MERQVIKLTRDSGWTDRIRSYHVVVNGEKVGEIKNGESKNFDIAPGTHEMMIKIDWCSSNLLTFDVKANEDVSFECGSNLKGIKVILAFVYVLFMRNKYLWLKQG